MPEIIEINDIYAPELDVFARLTEVQLRNRKEQSCGLFIAESATAVRLALDAGYLPHSLLIERRQLTAEGAEIADRIGNVPVYTADDSLLEKLTGYHLTRGVLCAFRRKPLPRIAQVLRSASRIVVLEDITDSTNVGAIFRSAAALGMDAVLVSDGCCDPLCRRSVRVSMGTVFQVPWTRASDSDIPVEWHKNGIEYLHSLGYKTAAMALRDNSVSVDDSRLRSTDKIAVIMGTEGRGLSDATIAQSDYTVKIPMCNGVDSLNVAAASAVIFWELRR